MKFPPPKLLRPGDELTTGWLNWVLRLAKRNTIELGANSGLSMVQNENGTSLRVASTSKQGTVGITSSTISARSGLTPGSGTVDRYSYDEDSGDLVDDEQSEDVLNFSSTTDGIASGTYVWIEQDGLGFWWITAVDCGD